MNYSPTKFLTTRQLSRVWFVSEATIKRWADTGQLKSSRTVGGHRRFPLAEVMRFQTERGLGVATVGASVATSTATARAETFDAEQVAGQFFEAVKRGRAGEATALLLEAHMLGAELDLIFDAVVAPSLQRVGDLWYGDARRRVSGGLDPARGREGGRGRLLRRGGGDAHAARALRAGGAGGRGLGRQESGRAHALLRAGRVRREAAPLARLRLGDLAARARAQRARLRAALVGGARVRRAHRARRRGLPRRGRPRAL